jgi:hypothetical protein
MFTEKHTKKKKKKKKKRKCTIFFGDNNENSINGTEFGCLVCAEKRGCPLWLGHGAYSH